MPANKIRVSREQLLTFINDNPGCTKVHLAEFAGVSVKGIDNHLRKLLKAGTITSKTVKAKKQYYPNHFDGGAGAATNSGSASAGARNMGSSIRDAFMQAVPNDAATQILEQMLPGIVEQGLKFAQLPSGWHCTLCSNEELLASLRSHIDRQDYLQAMLTAGAILVRSKLIPKSATTPGSPPIAAQPSAPAPPPEPPPGDQERGGNEKGDDRQDLQEEGTADADEGGQRQEESSNGDSQEDEAADPEAANEDEGEGDEESSGLSTAGLSFLGRSQRSPEEIAESAKRGQRVTHHKGV